MGDDLTLVPSREMLSIGVSRARDLLVVSGDLELIRCVGGEGVAQRLATAFWPRGMSGLNHDRPQFKVGDAGGGERIRTIATIAEKLCDIQRAAPVSAPPGASRCGLCGSRREVTGHLQPLCMGCREQKARARAARRADGEASGPRRPPGTLCPRCHTELPVAGRCGCCS